MNPIRTRRAWCASLGVAALLALHGPALAQDSAWPTKPVRIVVTFPPGGSADAVVRLIAPRLADKLGQQVVVDNRPGAGGNVGLTVVAKAPGDGHTLGVGAAGALAANSSLYPNMPFDPLKDFKPVSMLAAIPFVIVGHPSVGAKDLKELIGLARGAPGEAVHRPWRQRHGHAPDGRAVRRRWPT
jgi:tripartite-type tricarboxylate transporter receptor subunit TctC